MAQNFPSNPIVGNSYTVNNESWTYDGSGWTRSTTATADAILPAQTGNSGKYLTTDGTTASWGTVAAAVPKITSISVTDSSYTVLDDTAVSTAGGYIKITGTGFTAGSQVLIGTVTASSVSFISSTELRAQLPATGAGTYVVYVVAADGAVAIRVNGITSSSTPTWSTGSSLGTNNATISIQLTAVSDTAITYSLAAGSTLPSGLSLSSSGLLSGTVTGVTVETVYNFTINAVDLENQDSPRTFSITITIKDPSFPYVPLLLETAAVSTRSTVVTDSSTNAFTVTRNGTPSTGWVSPYQTDGYWGNYFGTTTSDNIYAASNVAFTVGTNNFTVEFWANWTAWAGTNQRMILMGQSGSSAIEIGRDSGANTLNVYTNGSSAKISYTWTPTTGTWYHVAVVRSGTGANQLTLYINGTNVGTGTSADSITTNNFFIGGLNWAAGYNMQGYISNVRFVNGTAVYTGSFTPSTTPLTTIANTVLLTCQSNRFRDNSTNNFAITVSGTPQVNPYFYPSVFTAPAASPGAALFNGTTDYVTSTIPALSGVFTIDFWLYRPASGNNYFFTIGDSFTSTSLEVYIGTSGTVFNVYSNNAARITSSTLPTVGAWNYIAVTRDASNVITFYLNGSQIGSTYTSAVTFATTLRIGVEYYNGSISGYGNNYISNFRISNNIRTVNSIPTASFISDANTFLLLNLGDSNYTSATNAVQNNTFIDTGPYAFPITRNGTATQGSITPYWPDGYWSNYFNGSTDWLTVADNAAFQPGSGNFTFEAWVYLISLPSASNFKTFWAHRSAINTIGGAAIVFDSTGAIQYYISNSGATGWQITGGSTGFSVTLNSWQHIALTRSGNTLTFYKNGVAGTIATVATGAIGTSSNLSLMAGAADGGQKVDGYMSNFRMVKGTAVYTGAFTPSMTPLTAIANTSLLTCQSNRFRDNSTNSFALTVNGTPQVQAFQPFSPAAEYTPALYGGSGYFGANNDYLTAGSSTTLALGAGDFTVELWVYLTAYNSNQSCLVEWRTNGGSGANIPCLFLNGSGILLFYASVGSGVLITGSSPVPLNAWTHIAVVRSGTGASNIKIYLNGVNIGSGTNTSTLGIETFAINNPQLSNQNIYVMYGYMSNIRIVKGTAVYTAAFTPPTTPVTAITNTSLLLNFTNAAIYDASTQNNVTTVGNAQASTTQFKWLPTSMRFDGSGSFLTMPIPSGASTTITSGDFTIEFWLNPSTVSPSSQAIVGTRFNDSLNNMNWGVMLASNRLEFFLYSSAQTYVGYITHQTALSINTWYYCALVRSGSTFTLYINGVAGTSTLTSSATMGQFHPTLYVGRFGSVTATGIFTGYIQDLRITRGVARNVTTIPTLAFQTR